MDVDSIMYASFLDELQKIAVSKQRIAVPHARTGRRSMSVDTLLQKDKEGTLFKQHDKVEKNAGLMDVLKTPIPGTKDWFINTGKQGLTGASRMAKAAPRALNRTRTSGGVTSIGEGELKRMGFGDLAKRASSEHVKEHTNFQGLPIAIENPVGSVREGVDRDGKPWKTTFKLPYGFIKGTKGKDGEEIDAYIGPHKDAPEAHVVHQNRLDGKGHDEDKVMLGFKSQSAARKAYLAHYNTNGLKLLGPISTFTVDALKQKLEEKRHHTKLAVAPLGIEERTEPAKKGDVPSRDGVNPGGIGAGSNDLEVTFLKQSGIFGAANPFKGGPGMFQRFGQDLMTGGKMLGSQKLVAPGKFAPAGIGSRVAGEVAHSAGHHYAHKSTLGNVINPLGGALGGISEGLTRSAGKELAGAGKAVGGRAGNAMGTVGGGLQRAAKPMGYAGEVAGLAGLGTALHAPLSLAGAVGGKLLGTAAHAAPALGEALHNAGHTAAHAAHDVVGNAAHSVADKARNFAGFAPAAPRRPVTGYSVMPPPMAAGAH